MIEINLGLRDLDSLALYGTRDTGALINSSLAAKDLQIGDKIANAVKAEVGLLLLNGIVSITGDALQQLDKLSSLKKLNIEACSGIHTFRMALPELTHLCADYCSGLKNLVICRDLNDSNESCVHSTESCVLAAPKLTHLSVKHASKIASISIDVVGLEKLEIMGLPELTLLKVNSMGQQLAKPLKLVCSNLSKLQSVEIEADNCAPIDFSGSKSLQHATLAGGVWSVDFSNCSSLKKIGIRDPSQIKALRLAGCSGLPSFEAIVRPLILDPSGNGFLYKNLQMIRLNGCRFPDLPRYLTDNPINCKDTLEAYFIRRLEEGEEDFDWAKILILGNAWAGKSTLLSSILTKTALKPEQLARTKGIALRPASEANFGSAEFQRLSKYQLKFWDFGGQDLYHRAHHSFISNQCVYVVVWKNGLHKDNKDTSKTEEPTMWGLDYWIKTVRSINPLAEFIVVRTHVNMDEKEEVMDEKEEVIPVHRLLPPGICEGIQTLETGTVAGNYLEISVPGSGGRRLMLDKIERAILALRPNGSSRRPLGDKLVLERMGKQVKPWLTHDEFRDLLNQVRTELGRSAVGEKCARGVADSFHNMGALFQFEGGVIINQKAFIETAYAVLETLRNGGGKLADLSDTKLISTEHLKIAIEKHGEIELQSPLLNFFQNSGCCINIVGRGYYIPFRLNECDVDSLKSNLKESKKRSPLIASIRVLIWDGNARTGCFRQYLMIPQFLKKILNFWNVGVLR